MQATSDAVVQALQSVLRLECTAMEAFHSQEHYWQRCGYKKLKKCFDKLVSSARARKRIVLDRLFQFDVMPVTDPAQFSCQDSVLEGYQVALDRFRGLNEAYQTVVSVCRQVEDSVTEDLANDAQYEVQKYIAKFEAKIEQVNAIGEPAYIATIL